MNFKGLKKKLARFKSIFTEHWSSFTAKHSRYNTDYHYAEIKKCFIVVARPMVLRFMHVCRAGKVSIKLILAAKAKHVRNVESGMPERA